MFKNKKMFWRSPGLSVELPAGGINDLFHYAGKKELTAIIGRSAAGPVALNLETAPHVIIAGTTGSGKSVCIQTIINCLIIKNNPAGLRLSFCDPKKIDYIRFSGLPFVDYYGSENAPIIAVLRAENAIMQGRYTAMQKSGIYDYKAHGMPARLIVFDELPAMLDSANKKQILPLLKDLLRLGRAAGMHVIIGSQVANSTIIDTQIKANCPVRIAFRVTSATQSRVIIERNGAESLAGRGDGLLFDQYGSLQRFQGFIASDAQQAAILNYWKDKRKCTFYK